MGSLNRHVRRQMAKFAGKVDKKALKRIIAQEGGQGGASAAGATAPGGARKGPLERRMPEKGELFVLAGVDFSTPVLFSLEGYTDDGRAIIRFAKKEDFQTPIAQTASEKSLDQTFPTPSGATERKIDYHLAGDHGKCAHG